MMWISDGGNSLDIVKLEAPIVSGKRLKVNFCNCKNLDQT